MEDAERIKEIMIDFSTYKKEYNLNPEKIKKEYSILYSKLKNLNIGKNPFKNLNQFYNNYKNKLYSYEERRKFTNSLYSELSEYVEVKNIEDNFWADINPEIKKVSKTRYESKHYADSVESAVKEINDKVKNLYKNKTNLELDGVNLMRHAFKLNENAESILEIDDNSPNVQEKKNIQEGYMNLFVGIMQGIRAPKAHRNIKINSLTARHHLYLASLLMYTLDKIK